MNTIPRISVVMSIYNEPEEWIRTAIDSILSQTMTDFEFIIINDNPTNENNFRLLQEYIYKDSRVRIIQNTENLGLTKSLNIGLREARGEFIARMDADDFAFSERFEIQFKYLQQRPEYIACSAMAYFWDGIKLKGRMYRPVSEFDMLTYLFASSPFVHPLLMMRRSSIEAYNISYNEDFRYSQDYRLAADMIKVGKIGNVDDYLLKYRVSTQQISNKFGHEQQRLTMQIRRDLINWYYAKFSFPALAQVVSIDSIKENYHNTREFCRTRQLTKQQQREFCIVMNCIRRLLYYSLIRYSWRSLWLFLKSGDYFRIPYKLRRFVIVIWKHFDANIVPRLL